MTAFRTLVHVTARKEDWIEVVLPARDADERGIFLPVSSFPEEVQPRLLQDYTFYAKVNFGVESKYDLEFDEFEFTP